VFCSDLHPMTCCLHTLKTDPSSFLPLACMPVSPRNWNALTGATEIYFNLCLGIL
jgi:hypothetical protein